MTKKTVFLLSLGVAAAILVFSTIYVLTTRTPEVQTPAASSNTFPGHPPSGGAPSKSNVNQTYLSRIEGLKKSVAANPGNVNHLAMLARLLMDGHQAADAIQYFEQAVRVQPKNDSLLLDLSVCYSVVKKYDLALTATDRLLANDPKNLTALYNKGALLATQGKTADAARWWKKILATAPDTEEAQKAKAGLAAIGM